MSMWLSKLTNKKSCRTLTRVRDATSIEFWGEETRKQRAGIGGETELSCGGRENSNPIWGTWNQNSGYCDSHVLHVLKRVRCDGHGEIRIGIIAAFKLPPVDGTKFRVSEPMVAQFYVFVFVSSSSFFFSNGLWRTQTRIAKSLQISHWFLSGSVTSS
jgi:hypothetical protein